MTTATASSIDTATLLLPLALANDITRCGSKAATLAVLRHAGCPVPDGFVIPARIQPTRDQIAAALERLGPGPWAVRSSAIAEDLADASFAGQYVSLLNLTTLDEVAAAADQVRASGTAAHLAAYRQHPPSARDDAASGDIAVLIQTQVSARAAGIAFSADPITGDDRVVIEAVRGLGDQLASGELDADRWIDEGDPRPIADTGVLDQPAARRIADLVRKVALTRGFPQDIEWALDENGQLFLLQARPITGLPRPPKFDVPPGRWMKDNTHWSGPMTPAGAAIMLPLLERSMSGILQEFGLPLEAMRVRTFGGEVYTQEIEVGGKHNPGSPPPWWLGAIVFRVIPPLRKLAATAEKALPKLESYPRAWETTWRAECARRIDEARAVRLDSLTDADLLAHLQHLMDDVLYPAFVIHFKLMFPDMVATHELAKCCEESLGWSAAQTLELLAGVSGTATRPLTELADIADLSGPDNVRQGLAAVRASAAGSRFDAWLGLWGLRAVDLDPGSATLSEHPAIILAALRQPRPDLAARERARQSAIARARGILVAPEKRARFDAALALAERIHPQREENVLYTQSLPLGLVRHTLLELGRRLVASGELRHAADIVFLEPAEFRSALAHQLTGESAARLVRRRRAERAWVQAHPGPVCHGPAPVPPPSARGLPAGLQRILSALIWDLSHEETAQPPTAAPDTLVGTAASAGRVTGRARVIHNESELATLESGEILVCPSTHSTWAVVFAKAAAIVTDHGGALSHPSIVAREYGIPAVVGTGDATKKLRTGQIITVDGTAGRVEMSASPV